SGLAAQWGGKFKIGEVPFYAFFSEANVPAVSFLYHSMALTSDIMVRFNEWSPSHYRLFNIQTVVAPAGPDVEVPPFLAPIGQNGRFRIFSAPVFSPPGGSYFEVVDALASVKTTRNNFYDIDNRWLESDWVIKRIHLLLDWHDDAPPWIPRMAPEDALSRMPVLPFPGEVKNEQRYGETYRAELDARRLCYALFKMTWHANWKAYVDGIPVKTVMLSPGFIGVPLTSGHHQIVCHYEPGRWRGALAIVGFITVILLMAGEWRGFAMEPALAGIRLRGIRPRTDKFPGPRVRREVPRVRREVAIACGLVLLAAPVCIPLFTGSVLWGHDGFAYFPRLVEVDQNIAHGVLVPRWAPDLGRGSGQPLFLFHPPMIYYFGELWRLLGCSFVTAMNLACATVVLASAVGMFLLARLYFGETGGWLGAAAYLYVPYFAVDLYVRSAMEELAAFPFIALAMYGFGAFAAGPKSPRARRYWLIGVAAYTGLLLCHFPAALLFTPLLLAFLALTAWMEKSWQVLIKQALGFVLALGLGAFIWVPALAARPNSMMNRAVEG
ncbi:MAG TPA: glycosyltransferase family 39 protein, partial [Candidatus Solibacter sp.]|nr:glycosyltransferase family 39 protein [Candidatus Solibacter sp.]